MRKTALGLIVIFALLASLVIGAETLDMVNADFVPTSPDTDPPIISIISPTNKTYENKVLLHLNITALALYQDINFACYTLDTQDYVVNGNYENWSATLEGLSEGMHAFKVTASCRSYYATPTSGGALYYRIYWGYSEIVNFSVVYPPQTSILSPENKIYDSDKIPLDFMVNEQVSKIEYSLDGQANVLVSGNTTLTGLAVGLHNLTILAEDTDGNLGTSETVFFTISEPFPTTLAIASVIAVGVVVMGWLVWFKKRQRGKNL